MAKNVVSVMPVTQTSDMRTVTKQHVHQPSYGHLTVQGNKSKFNHSSSQQWPWDFPPQVGTEHSMCLKKNYINISFRSVVAVAGINQFTQAHLCMI